MLHVKTPDEVFKLIQDEFAGIENRTEYIPLVNAVGRVLAEDIHAREYVPDFSRSMVDGFAVRAADTFGCCDASPAILPLCGEIRMGQKADFTLPAGTCCAVPTGGDIPDGADCAVMLEYTEDFGNGVIGINQAGAPGENIIFRGGDVYPGKLVLKAGRLLAAQDIGALAAIGQTYVPVVRRLRVGILSTGDELVPFEEEPGPGQVRDVNAPMLASMLTVFGVEEIDYGIIADDETLLDEKMHRAAEECDAVLVSGGSSAGTKDKTCSIIESMGTVLLHGIAMKPGKPTIIGKAGNKPLIGLPGHPGAAFFVAKLFVLPLLGRLMGRTMPRYTVRAELTESIGANHGRAQYNCCYLKRQGAKLLATPIRSQSGLITQIAGADGFFCIGRDCEGLPEGAEIQVTLCMGD